jgi:hypothetical protein
MRWKRGLFRAVVWAAAPGVLAAQEKNRVAGGRVLYPGSDGARPATGATVVLHRLSQAAQGPIDSVRADATGHFSFRFRGDTATVFLISVRYSGIDYFSDAVPDDSTATNLQLVVYDTSSSAPVGTAKRTLVVQHPDPQGRRPVLDWTVIDNPGTVTRVAVDSGASSWGGALPIGAVTPHIASAPASPFGDDAVTFRHDSVFVAAALSPGPKELWLQYQIPPQAKISFPVADVDSVQIYFDEPTAKVTGAGVTVDSVDMDGRHFTRFSAGKGTTLLLEFTIPGDETHWLPFVVMGFALLLGVASYVLVRRGRKPGSLAGGTGPA